MMKRLGFICAALMLALAVQAQMTLPVLHELSAKMDKKEFADYALRECEPLLKATTVQEWHAELRLKQADTLSLLYMPTLYDLIMDKAVAQTNQEERKDSLYQAWLAFHENDQSVLPKMYIRLKRLPFKGTAQRMRIYHEQPDGWERGYLLVNATADWAYYQDWCDYVKRWPESPYVENVRRLIDQITQESVNCVLDHYVCSTDSLHVTLDVCNAKKVTLEIYRVPMISQYANEKRMPMVYSELVQTDSVVPFKKTMKLSLPPLTYGAYMIYPRIEGDTANVRYLYAYHKVNGEFEVSDLRVMAEVYRKAKGLGTTHRIWVVADARTGDPVKHVWRWGNKLRRGKDKYLPPVFGAYQSMGTINTENNNLAFVPNAVIFRPGDTLRLTMIGSQQPMKGGRLLAGESVKISMRSSSDWKYLFRDSVLMLDSYGRAQLDLPLTDDMRRGTYSIFAHSQSKHHNVSRVFTFSLEDYRLPTFVVALDEQNKRLFSDSLTTLTGQAMRTNGEPMSGQDINLTLLASWNEGNVKELDTVVVTDQTGAFRLDMPASVLQKTADSNGLLVAMHVRAADGEQHNAQQCIYRKEHQPDPLRYTLADGICPPDELLWVPDEGAQVNEEGKATLVVGVPHDGMVYVVAMSRFGLLSHGWVPMHEGLNTLTYQMPKGTDEYVWVNLYRWDVKGEQWVERSKRIMSPKKTRLHITPVSFRDYITPGAEEQWTFRVTNNEGQRVDARMLVVMTDQAVENLSKYNYGQLPLPWQQKLTTSCIPYYNRLDAWQQIPLPKRRLLSTASPILFAPYRADSLIMVQGVVRDVNGYPLIGAIVQELGFTNATISDYNGEFELLVGTHSRLEASYIAHESQTLDASPSMVFVLEEYSDKVLEEVFVTGYGNIHGSRGGGIYGFRDVSSVNVKASYTSAVAGVQASMRADALGVEEEEEESVADLPLEKMENLSLRNGDTRLALYTSDLYTDVNGEVHYSFRAPDDNTVWNVNILAWARDASSDHLSRSVTATRTLMAHLTVPRFMREGDRLQLSCRVQNTADTAEHVLLRWQLFDVLTDSILQEHQEWMQVAPHGETTASLMCDHADRARELGVRVHAQNKDGVSDGEQRQLTILPAATAVHEAVPFFMPAEDTLLTVTMPDIPASATEQEYALTVCTNPFQLILNDLPHEQDTTAVTAPQLMHNLYALSLRNRLASQYPDQLKTIDVAALVKKIKRYQRANGGFTWLNELRCGSSFHVTMRMVGLMGELQEYGALPDDLKSVLSKAAAYLDKEVVDAVDSWRKHHPKDSLDYNQFRSYAIVRAMAPAPLDAKVAPVMERVLHLMATPDPDQLVNWPMTALTLERAGHHDEALRIVHALRGYAMNDRLKGMYWNNLPDFWWWYRQSELQANFLLAFDRIDPQVEEISQMKQWLLQNSRTTQWGQASLNAYASFALLSTADVWHLVPVDEPVQTQTSSVFNGTIRKPAGAPAWGFVSVNYQAPAAEVRPFATEAISVRRTFVRDGDKVRVVLTVRTDREMDNVILRDARPAALEPLTTQSSYQWHNALYYQEVKNDQHVFYISHLSKGETVFTYDCYISTRGHSQSGLAEIECELAPEFTAHTAIEVIE